MTAAAAPPLGEVVVDEVLGLYPDRTGDVLGILEELQKRHPAKYLPVETLKLVASKTGLAPSRIYSVATFYSFFSLSPQHDHTLMVCRGTACHTRGARLLLERLKEMSPTKVPDDAESFTIDRPRMTVRAVACIGQCALAPALNVDERVVGHVTELDLRSLLQEIDTGGSPA
jgi:NADH-quinone oxidoreductase subunit E